MKPFSLWAACGLLLSFSWVNLAAAAADIGAFSYASKPMPKITVNGRQNQALLYPGQPFSASISLEAGAAKGQRGDWWMIAVVGQTYFYRNTAGAWLPGLQATRQGPIDDFNGHMFTNLVMPAGEYDLFFGVDLRPDGQLSLDSLRFDWVHVSIPATALRTFYVSNNGNDNNPGNKNRPWKTLAKAAATARAGDLVWVRNGTYKQQLLPKNSGTAAHPLVFAAYPGEKVVLDGKGLKITNVDPGPPFKGVVHVHKKNHVWIVGFTVQNTSDIGIMGYETDGFVTMDNYVTNSASSGIAVWKSTNVLVDGNEINKANTSTKGQENISIGESVNGFEVRYNHVHDSAGKSHGGEGINIKDGSSNGSVHHNHVHDIPYKLCMYIDAWDTLSQNIDVHHNVLHDCNPHGLGITAERGGRLKNIKVYNNVMYRNKITGVHVGLGYRADTDNVQIYNNSFYKNGINNDFGASVLVKNKKARNIKIFNNACNSTTAQVSVLEKGGTVTIKNNLYARKQDKFNGEQNGDPFFVGDPMWVNPDKGDFRLKAGSPAIGKSNNTLVPATDFRGQPR